MKNRDGSIKNQREQSNVVPSILYCWVIWHLKNCISECKNYKCAINLSHWFWTVVNTDETCHYCKSGADPCLPLISPQQSEPQISIDSGVFELWRVKNLVNHIFLDTEDIIDLQPIEFSQMSSMSWRISSWRYLHELEGWNDVVNGYLYKDSICQKTVTEVSIMCHTCLKFGICDIKLWSRIVPGF